MPAPVSPWKYSWKSSRSRHSGSVWNFAIAPVDRPAAVGVGQPDRDEPCGEVLRDVAQPDRVARPGRVLDREVVAQNASQLRSDSMTR